MATDGRAFSTAFSRLCHFVALRRDDDPRRAAQDAIVKAAFVFEEDLSADADQIKKAVRALFSLEFEGKEIASSLARLKTQGHLEIVAKNRFRLTGHAAEEIQERVRTAEALEQAVRDEWLEQLSPDLSSLSLAGDVLWGALKAYLSRMFARHGLQTVHVLSPALSEAADDESLASSILEQVAKEHLPSVPTGKSSRLIRSFFAGTSQLRTSYLAELLDGTFSFFSLTLDRKTAEQLGGALSPLRLIVDTNFIFGLLDLHSNAYVSVSKEVVRLVREFRLPVTLYYHPLTVAEFKSTLAWHAKQLARGNWTPALSRALLESGTLTGVERRFHELNSEARLDVAEFFARYRNVSLLLEEQGLRVFQRESDALLKSDQLLNEISQYKKFIEPREKRFSILQHDIALSEIVRQARKQTDTAFHSDTFFLTCDFLLWRFDRNRSRRRGEPQSALLPNVFLQLLRPLVPRTEDFDRSFVDTFSLPEFRTATSATAEAMSRVASVLRLYSDLPEKTAVELLSNEALISRIEQRLDASEEEVASVVDDALADELRDAREEVYRLNEELSGAQKKRSAETRQETEDRKKLQADLENARGEIEILKRGVDGRARDESRRPQLLESAQSIPAEIAAALREREAKEVELAREIDKLTKARLRLANLAWSLGYVLVAGMAGLTQVTLLELLGVEGMRRLLLITWSSCATLACAAQLSPWIRPRKDPAYWRSLLLLLSILLPLLAVVPPPGVYGIVASTIAVTLALLGSLRRDSHRA